MTCTGSTRTRSRRARRRSERSPAPTRAAVIEALARSIHVVFLFAVPLAVLAFVVTWLLKESPLRETAHIGLEDVVGEPVVPKE